MQKMGKKQCQGGAHGQRIHNKWTQQPCGVIMRTWCSERKACWDRKTVRSHGRAVQRRLRRYKDKQTFWRVLCRLYSVGNVRR